MIVNSKQQKELGLWKLTAVGSFVADVSAIKAAGGSRKVTLPNSTLRIADLEWSEIKDVEGRVMCWQRTIAGVRVLIRNNSQEEQMTAKSKKKFEKEVQNLNTELAKVAEEIVATKDAAPQVPEKKAEPKVPKAINYAAEGEVRAVKQGSKLSLLIDELGREEGTTLELLAAELSRTGSKVDVAGVRSWISYDLRRVGLGCRTGEDGRLYLVGTPLSHKVAEPRKVAEATIKIVGSEPKMKKAAMTSKKSKKAAR